MPRRKRSEERLPPFWVFDEGDAIVVTVDYVFDSDEVRRAILWGRGMRFSYEKDDNLAGLLEAARSEGVIRGDVDSSGWVAYGGTVARRLLHK